MEQEKSTNVVVLIWELVLTIIVYIYTNVNYTQLQIAQFQPSIIFGILLTEAATNTADWIKDIEL